MISRIFISLGVTALPGAAWAHTGHIADHGQGHSHWLALAILGGLSISLLGWGLARFTRILKRRHQP